MFFVYVLLGFVISFMGILVYCAIEGLLDFFANLDKSEEYDVLDLDDPEEEDDSCGKI